MAIFVQLRILFHPSRTFEVKSHLAKLCKVKSKKVRKYKSK